MNVKTRIVLASLMTVLGAIVACCSGIMAGNYQMGEMPAIGSIIAVLGIMLFMAGLAIVAVLLIFGGDDEQ